MSWRRWHACFATVLPNVPIAGKRVMSPSMLLSGATIHRNGAVCRRDGKTRHMYTMTTQTMLATAGGRPTTGILYRI